MQKTTSIWTNHHCTTQILPGMCNGTLQLRQCQVAVAAPEGQGQVLTIKETAKIEKAAQPATADPSDTVVYENHHSMPQRFSSIQSWSQAKEEPRQSHERVDCKILDAMAPRSQRYLGMGAL